MKSNRQTKSSRALLLSHVKEKLRRGEDGYLENCHGYAVFSDATGRRSYVFEDETGIAVTFQAISRLYPSQNLEPSWIKHYAVSPRES